MKKKFAKRTNNQIATPKSNLMEDDYDFGALYTDVLRSFPSTSQPSSFAPPPPPQNPPDSLQSDRHGPDANLLLKEEDDDAAGISNSKILAPHGSAGFELNLSSSPQLGSRDVQEHEAAKGCENREFGRDDGDFGGNFDEENFRFDLEEEGNGDVGLGPVIPGLSTTGPGGGDAFDDWDSDDSEDDLQIVLNETSQDPVALEMGTELDDCQNERLGIGADGQGVGFQHPGIEDQEWGDDGAQAADREKKEGGELTKLHQGISMPPKPGFPGHGYHTLHSQFKYVRPGAAPLQGAPAAGPIGAPGQVRPIVNLGPMAGRGRGDWRSPVMKNVPGMQKGYGGPGWGNNGGGRGLGIGLDFTLPSHKTIFEVDIDGFEEKPWNNPGVDVTDFFNFGLTEESWKGYCKQLEQFRLASTMQSRIHVYESGRSEQAYDPDMPPELAAAAGVSDNAADNVNFRRTDVDHIDVAKSSTPGRPAMPAGRPIQVETGSGERLPSIDTRPLRIRDSDAIIEIVCEGFAEGQLSEDDAPQSSEHDEPSKTNHMENHESEDVPEQSKWVALHSSERRLLTPVKVHQHSEPSGSGEHTPVQSSDSEGRHRRRLEGESPHLISGGNNMQDDQSEGSIDGIDGKSNVLVSPDKVKDDQEMNADHMARDDDDPASAVKPAALDDDIKHDKTSSAKNQHTASPRSERQKFASHGDLFGQDYGENIKATRSGDNSKPRPGNCEGFMKSHDVGEEVVQVGHGESLRNSKRHLGDDELNVQKRNDDERHDMERSRDVVNGREDPSLHRVGSLAKPSYVKYESSNKRKERDSLEGVCQRMEEASHDKRARTNEYRKQDPRLMEHGDEMGSIYSSNAWDGDRIEKKDHLYARKQIDTGNWRAHHNKDVGLRLRERDESLKTRHENVDNYRKRKTEENLRRDYSEKEELLLSHKESLRKRKNEDHLDQRRRIEQARTRENIKDHHSLRLKDEMRMEREKSERPNDRDDRRRTKQYREGSMTKREREEVREPIRSGRVIEDKWASHAKEKDELNVAARCAESKRRDRVDDVHLTNNRGHEDIYAHRTTSSNLDSKFRKDGPSSHTNHNGSSNLKVTDEKPKESARNKGYDSRSQNSQTISKRVKNDHNSHRSEKVGTKHSRGQGNTVHQTEGHPNSTRKSGEEPATVDDEQQQSKKGRSKMERWTSHKERDFTAIVKPASSLKVERIRSSINTETSMSAEPANIPTKSAEFIDPKPSEEDKALQGVDTKKEEIKEVEHKNSDPLQAADQHLDTVARLKKRSERFKLPLPSEKDTMNKKKETEVLETPPADAGVKSERPPRKRRWIRS